jgi:hypothetical protein
VCVRIAILILWLVAGPAFAAGERDANVARLDFAAAASFDSAVETHFAPPDTRPAPQHSPRVSQKLRVALWTSQSILPPRAEVLRPKPPAVLLLDSAPTERIAAKIVIPTTHESTAPYYLGNRPKRIVRPRPAEVEDDEKPSLLQRIVKTVLPGSGQQSCCAYGFREGCSCD